MTLLPRYFYVLLIAAYTCKIQAESNDNECYLPRYYKDFFKLQAPDEKCTFNSDTRTIECTATNPTSHLKADGVTKLGGDVKLVVNCHGDWVDFSLLGLELREMGINLTGITLKNCQYLDGTFHLIFNGHEKTLESINVTCCSFVSTVKMPNFKQFTALKRLNLAKNSFYPMHIAPRYSDRPIEFPFFLDNGIRCFGAGERENLNISLAYECFCSTSYRLLNVSCVNIKETELLHVLDNLHAAGATPIGSVKVFSLTVDGQASNRYVRDHWHMLALAAALTTRYKPLYDIRVRNCTFLPDSQRTDTIFETFEDRTLNISYLMLSACYESDVKDTSLPFLLYFVPNRNYSEELYMDLSQNGLARVGISVEDKYLLHTLLLYGNSFKTISAATFAPWSTSLKHLGLRDNRLIAIEPGALSSLESLEVLDIMNNNVDYRGWPPSAFTRASSLNKLTIGGQDVGIYNYNFKDLAYLTELEFAQINHPQDIGVVAFEGMGKLKTFRFLDSDLSQLPPTAFKPMYSLAELDGFAMGTVERNQDIPQLFSNLETLRTLTTGIHNLYPVCEVLGRMPLLRTLHPAYSDMYCANDVLSAQLFKWLKVKMYNDKLITIEHLDRIRCKFENTSWKSFFENSDFDHVNITSIPVPKTTIFNWSVVSPTPDTIPDLPDFENEVLIFTVLVTFIIALCFAIPCYHRRDLWLPSSKTWRTWLFGTFLKERCPMAELKRFHQTTSFDGFAQAGEASSQCLKIMWHILIVVFAGLTAQGLAMLYFQFKYGGTVVNLMLLNNNTFIQQPFTVCMPVAQREIMLSNKDLDNIFSDDPHCRKEAYPFHLMLFANIVLHRAGQQFTAEMSMPKLKDVRSFFNVSYFDEILRERNVTLRTLIAQLSGRMCHLMHISAYVYDHSPGGRVLQRQILSPENCSDLFQNYNEYGLTWYDDTITQQMCLRFPGIFSFTGTSTLGSLSLTPLFPVTGNDRLMVDLDGYSSPLGIEQVGNPLRVPAAYETELALALESVVVMMQQSPSGATMCYRNCYRSLRLPDIQDRCGCRPLMWSNYSNPLLPDCTVDAIRAECNVTSGAAMCEGSIPCLNFKYGITKEVMDQTVHGETTLTFRIINSVYSFQQEQPAMSGSTFLGSVGGVLGFWLSASFMGLIHFALWLLEFLVVVGKKSVQTANSIQRSIRSRTNTLEHSPNDTPGKNKSVDIDLT